MQPQTLIRPDGTALTYDKFVPNSARQRAGIVFLHGFRADRLGPKIIRAHEWCRANAAPFVAFDFFAHGQSGGNWDDFTIGRAVHDALLVLDTLTEGPQILIGSSMGGWVALRAMEERPERIAGFIGVAAAPDFTKWVAAEGTPEKRRAEGFTDAFMDEAPNQFVMNEDWDWSGPVHLLQGQADDVVDWKTPETIKAKLKTPDKCQITLVPDGDHRLNRPEDLLLMEAAMKDVINR